MPAQAVDLTISASWILPGNGLAPLRDGAVAVRDGRIVDIGTQADVAERASAAREVQLTEHLLAPGLINSHGHLAMSLFRGFAEDVPLQTWLSDRIWPLEARHVNEDFVRDGVRLAALEMLRAGVTCFSDMYFFPEIAAREARALGMRAQVTFPVIEMPNVWSRSAEEGIHKGLALCDEYRHEPLVQIAFGPHALYTVDETTLSRVLMFSEELDLNVQIHLHENQREVQDTRAAHGVSGIEYLEAKGLLGPRLQAVHVTQINAAEIELLAQANAHVVHCPTSNAKLACGISPISELLDAGVNVCLGTDGAASSNRQSVLAEARLASLLSKLEQGDASALDAPQALDMATINGATALGQADELGSLERGKWADVIAVDLRSAELQPLYDPIAQLVHTAADSNVTHVWVAGQALLDNRTPTHIDEADVLARAADWQARIAGSVAEAERAERSA